MADNVSITAGSGTTVASDDIGGGIQAQRVKVIWGPDGTGNDTDVASGKPMPVQLRTAGGTATPLPALGTAGSSSTDVITVQGIASGTALPVSIASVPSHAVTNAGTFAVQASIASAQTLATLTSITNVVHVDDNSGSLTVDGVVSATQGGTWTVQPGNTANTTAWKVDGSAVTQPVSLASVPSHAVTNAGTFAVQSAQSGTWTVQPGNTANTTAWKVDGSAVTQPVSGTLSAAQSGTWTVQPGNTANTTAWKVETTALGSTALDLGVGTGGSRTLRVALDSSQTEGSEYETVAASQTDQVIGATGATGDYLSHVVVSPGTAGCGVVTIKDNSTAIISFAGGGTTALSNLIPFVIPVGITSVSGAWKITTGANVTCVAVGNFT